MRVILIGIPADRLRLRELSRGTNLVIVGEAPSILVAQQTGPAADAHLVAADDAPDDVAAYQEALTTREHEVLDLLAEGLPNKAIADRLGISAQTVKFHVAALSGKLGALNRTDAVRRALKRGLVTL